MRHSTQALLLAFGFALASTASATAQSTTRIETRPYYGAVVSVEQGVRVWRPLPPHDRVIINPGNRANLNFEFNETRQHSTTRSTNHNHNHAAPQH